jgi:hypothetical protein
MLRMLSAVVGVFTRCAIVGVITNNFPPSAFVGVVTNK